MISCSADINFSAITCCYFSLSTIDWDDCYWIILYFNYTSCNNISWTLYFCVSIFPWLCTVICWVTLIETEACQNIKLVILIEECLNSSRQFTQFRISRYSPPNFFAYSPGQNWHLFSQHQSRYHQDSAPSCVNLIELLFPVFDFIIYWSNLVTDGSRSSNL